MGISLGQTIEVPPEEEAVASANHQEEETPQVLKKPSVKPVHRCLLAAAVARGLGRDTSVGTHRDVGPNREVVAVRKFIGQNTLTQHLLDVVHPAGPKQLQTASPDDDACKRHP